MERDAILAARREIARLRAAGKSDAAIAATLNQDRFSSPDEHEWLAETVDQFMQASRSYGPGYLAAVAPPSPLQT